MLILLSQNEQGISALYLQKHIFPSGSSSMKSTFPWMQRHYVNYYKGEQLYETNRRETALTHPRIQKSNIWASASLQSVYYFGAVCRSIYCKMAVSFVCLFWECLTTLTILTDLAQSQHITP